MGDKKNECVKVVVRIRPMNSEEERNGNKIATRAFSDRGLISVNAGGDDDPDSAKNFFFDHVYQPDCTQREIYDTCAADVVESVLGGYNGTIFAYGQVRYSSLFCPLTFVCYLYICICLFSVLCFFLSLDGFWKDPHDGGTS